MIIAVPIDDNKLALHFGHCKKFALVKVDSKEKKILSREDVNAPAHEPGLLPSWLAQLGVNMVIAGGIGQRAKTMFDNNNIKVLTGAMEETPNKLVDDYLQGGLKLGENYCDH